MKLKTILALLAAASMALTPCSCRAAELPESVKIISESDEDLILRVAMAEAGNQGIAGMRYVISTILNRVASDSPDFEDTIFEVVTHPYQYTTGYTGPISEDCREALQLELQEQIDTEILWFNSAGWPAYGERAFKYKDHWFCK